MENSSLKPPKKNIDFYSKDITEGDIPDEKDGFSNRFSKSIKINSDQRLSLGK
jgi:hypothetical protein